MARKGQRQSVLFSLGSVIIARFRDYRFLFTDTKEKPLRTQRSIMGAP